MCMRAGQRRDDNWGVSAPSGGIYLATARTPWRSYCTGSHRRGIDWKMGVPFQPPRGPIDASRFGGHATGKAPDAPVLLRPFPAT